MQIKKTIKPLKMNLVEDPLVLVQNKISLLPWTLNWTKKIVRRLARTFPNVKIFKG